MKLRGKEYEYSFRKCKITLIKGKGKTRIKREYIGVITDFSMHYICVKRDKNTIGYQEKQEIWIKRPSLMKSSIEFLE